MYESTYSGDIFLVEEDGFGQLWFIDYNTAYNLCNVMNNVNKYTSVKEGESNGDSE